MNPVWIELQVLSVDTYFVRWEIFSNEKFSNTIQALVLVESQSSRGEMLRVPIDYIHSISLPDSIHSHSTHTLITVHSKRLETFAIIRRCKATIEIILW